jgi:hypothetical protein
MKLKLCADSWDVDMPLLLQERPTLAQALEKSSWTIFSALEVRATLASAPAPAG